MAEWTDRDQDIVDARLEGDSAKAEVLAEIKRTNMYNEPQPEVCPKCGGEHATGGGLVGEPVLYCKQGCGICWEDSEEIIRRVF